jgi:aminoglycoside phosphotransferase (APT) family kinase protein
MSTHPRSDIYYWKCDRPAAFHGTQEERENDAPAGRQLREVLAAHFPGEPIVLASAHTQGNHLTWNADVGGRAMFVRIENGPEEDDQLEMETAVMQQVRALGIPVPKVFAVDASRARVPFAWQVMERVAFPDLNHWHKLGTLDHHAVAFDIGAAVARWQAIEPGGFGPFDLARSRGGRRLVAFHSRYEDYFRLRLDAHLDFLVGSQFLTSARRGEIAQAIDAHAGVLDLRQGCLVHKDLALWNILGSERQIAAFIDFDDAISGDPMDDLSLLACFHDAAFLRRAFEGYQSVRPLPEEHRRRLWLHLLRNMIVKAVIRVGAGYFERSGAFFLIGAGRSGSDLRQATQERIALALRGLRDDADITIL